jgi:hypothetical protein
MARTPKGMVQIGTIGVDAGLCYVGDPCYVIDNVLGAKPWGDFLDAMYAGSPEGADAPHWTVHSTTAHGTRTFAAGIVTTTGEGDGEYPVYAKIRDGRVRQILVDFGG